MRILTDSNILKSEAKHCWHVCLLQIQTVTEKCNCFPANNLLYVLIFQDVLIYYVSSLTLLIVLQLLFIGCIMYLT